MTSGLTLDHNTQSYAATQAGGQERTAPESMSNLMRHNV